MVATVLWTLLVGDTTAQKLARRNWQGSGLTVQPWWAHAIFCSSVATAASTEKLKSLAALMDALQPLGCDAVEIALPYLEDGAEAPAELPYGLVDGVEAAIEAAAHSNMRVLIDLPVQGVLSPAEERKLNDRMRFWLTQGAAGLVLNGHVSPSSDSSDPWIHRIRQKLAGQLAGRVLIVQNLVVERHLHATDPPGPADVDLVVSELTAPPTAPTATQVARLRAELSQLITNKEHSLPLITAESMGQDRTQAAILLATGLAARISTDALLQPSSSIGGESPLPSPDDLLLWIPKKNTDQMPLATTAAWFRRLVELHHANTNLHNGRAIFLDLDSLDALGWVVQAKTSKTAALVICNLSGHPVRVPAGAAVRDIGIRASSLKMLLRSGDRRVGSTIDAIDLAPGEVFVGEIR